MLTDSQIIDAAKHRVEEHDELRRDGLITSSGHFFPSGIHYPPITMYPQAEPEDFLASYESPPDDRYVFYFHIPFCMRRCTFCHYPVKIGASESEKTDYIDLMAAELDIWRNMLGVRRFKAHSLLVAGGTPTYLSPKDFARFHELLARRIDMSECSQFGYDVHPLDLLGPEGAERIRIMREFGSDRVTMGLNSLDDDVLKHMGRGHTEKQAYEAIDNLHKGGISDVCIEFIFGYPEMSTAEWMTTLRKAIAIDTEEIQLYRLKITPYGDSPGPIERLYIKHPERFPSAEETVLQKQASILLLAEHGYHENLTRVFAKKPGYISHYAADQCCRLLDCLGVGQSAFSSFRDRFSIHTPDLALYADRIRAGRLPLNRGVVRSVEDNLRWHLILPLKNSWVTKELYRARTGQDVGEVFRHELDMLGRYGLVNEDEYTIQLSAKGRFFADEITSQLGHPDYLPHPADSYADGPLNLSGPLEPRFTQEHARIKALNPACGLRSHTRPWPWTEGKAQPAPMLSL